MTGTQEELPERVKERVPKKVCIIRKMVNGKARPGQERKQNSPLLIKHERTLSS